MDKNKTHAISLYDGPWDNVPKKATCGAKELRQLLSHYTIRPDKLSGTVIPGASYPLRREGDTKAEIFAPKNTTPFDLRDLIQGDEYVSLEILDFDGGISDEEIEEHALRLNNSKGRRFSTQPILTTHQTVSLLTKSFLASRSMSRLSESLKVIESPLPRYFALQSIKPKRTKRTFNRATTELDARTGQVEATSQK